MGRKLMLDLTRWSMTFATMPDSLVGELIKAVIHDQEGFAADVREALKPKYEAIKAELDEQARRYEEKCAKYRSNATKRWNAMAMQWQCNGINQESESENEEDKERVTPKETVEAKGKVKEPNKENPTEKKGTEDEEKEETGQTELFEREEAEADEPIRANEKGEAKAAAEPRFKKPSVADVAAYVKEKGYEQWVDAEAFWSYHENRDWTVGNHKMKSWHLAVTTWMRNSKTRQPMRRAGTSVGERAYNMLHFEYEGHPEKWIEEEKKFAELQKYM